MFAELLYLTGIGLIVYGLYKWVVLNNDYFSNRGVKHLKPYFLFGNTFGFFTGRYNVPDFLAKIYDAFPDEKIVGFFDLRSPILAIRDPDVLKQIAVKDFDHFEDHPLFVSGGREDLFANSLFLLSGQKWRDMRATLSPAFTSSKMRQMFELVSECADEMAQYFVSEAKNGKQINQEMKELFSKYTNDVIATCAFGIKINSFKDPDNEFLATGKRFAGFEGLKTFIILIFMSIIPSLMRLLDIQIIDKTVRTFFRSMVLNNMGKREKEKIYRPDMINILMQVRKGNVEHESQVEEHGQADGFATVEESNVGKSVVKRKWNDNEIVAQCFLFFLAGFDTASTVLTFTTYELAVNKEIQDRLFDEIKSTDEQLQGKQITYDILQSMKYLDQVVCEVLRKWPPAAVVDRICIKDYNFSDGDKLNFRIDKNTPVWIPIYSFHHDKEYFPDPEKFDPERFNDDNKANIQPNTYIPFGSGPRNCIGSRFALMELKAIIYYLLLNFTVEPNEKTQIPIKLKKTPVALITEKGVHLEFRLRKQN